MHPILQIGPFALQTPGLILLAGVWLGLALAEKHARHYQIQAERLYNLSVIAILAGILGARLAYFGRYPGAFYENPASFFSLNPGLLDPLAGGVVGVISAVIYGQRIRLPLWASLDTLTSAFAVIGVAFGFSHLAAGTAFGEPTDLPWAIELWGARRHPTQVYEILSAGAILLLVWPRPGRSLYRHPGSRFFSFIAWSAGARLFLESFRGDSHFLQNGIRTVQIIAWLILALSLFAYFRLASRTQIGDEDPMEV